MCTMCIQEPVKLRRVVLPSRNRATGGCESSCRCWEPHFASLESHSMLNSAIWRPSYSLVASICGTLLAFLQHLWSVQSSYAAIMVSLGIC